jgi:dsDNA-binding SOS-regulon protein
VGSEKTNLHTKFLLQIWKQQEDSAMLLASNKQQHKEITKNRKTQQDRQNTEKRTAGKNKDQVGLQEAPNLQDSIQNNLENSKC